MPTVPNSNAQGSAGAYAGTAAAPQNGANTIASLLVTMRDNFLKEQVEIMPGLEFNQYKTLTTIHFYLNSRFETGQTDENDNDRFFHNLIVHRNAHTTKNIDLDTKDIRVTTELDNKYWASWLLRMEIKEWMRKNQFASNLNQLAEGLPAFGSVVWKKVKCKAPDGSMTTTVQNVDLRDLINDQRVESLRDSQLVAERTVMTAQKIREKAEEDGWDKEQVELLLQSMPVKKDQYLKEGASDSAGSYSLTDTLPSIDVYEVWGWVPETYLPNAPETADPTKYEYIMSIVGGVEGGAGARTLFHEKAKEEDFPYKEVHMRKVPGRWLGMGNTELLIPLQIRANELVNRFYVALRLGSVHLFQTRGKLYQKNLLQDALDGDIIESSHPIESVQTEIRAFQQYQTEMQMIEALADKICNTPEVVSGESMPAATPFRLGAMLGTNAAKLFDFVRENCGIFVGDIMRNWILQDLAEEITAEHMLDLIGSVEDLAAFDEAYRKSVLYGEVKTYVLKTGYLPTTEEFQVAERALSDQMKNGDRKIKIEEDFYDEDFLNTAQIVIDPTGESEDKAAASETLGNVLQIVTSNPMALQDPNIRMIMGKIMEMNGMSPIKLAGFVSQPQPPGGAAGAASPANAKFAANPGDAGANGEEGLTPASVASGEAAKAR